jgi:hypothetical protein
MPRKRIIPGEKESADLLRDRTRAWWMAVIAGQVDQSHPTLGTDVKARVKGDTLIISGQVPSTSDRREIAREVEHLKRHGINHIRNELKVVKEQSADMQTLLGVFDSEERAGFAAGYLEGHAQLTPAVLQVIAPQVPADARSALRALLPQDCWQDAEGALKAGRSLLILIVDETDAFKARVLLDEETRSLRTLVLPPEPARAAEQARRALEATTAPSGARSMTERAAKAHKRTLEDESAVHDG